MTRVVDVGSSVRVCPRRLPYPVVGAHRTLPMQGVVCRAAGYTGESNRSSRSRLELIHALAMVGDVIGAEPEPITLCGGPPLLLETVRGGDLRLTQSIAVVTEESP